MQYHDSMIADLGLRIAELYGCQVSGVRCQQIENFKQQNTNPKQITMNEIPILKLFLVN
jgi:hypothetical protein